MDWDNIEVEELMKPYEKFVAPSIVAEPPLDIDWSSHFTKQLVRIIIFCRYVLLQSHTYLSIQLCVFRFLIREMH